MAAEWSPDASGSLNNLPRHDLNQEHVNGCEHVGSYVCVGCGTDCDVTEEHDYPETLKLCLDCMHTYPAAVLKATIDDDWHYLARLTTGEHLTFSGAYINGDFVHLIGACIDDMESQSFERGLDVSVTQIAWVADIGH